VEIDCIHDQGEDLGSEGVAGLVSSYRGRYRGVVAVAAAATGDAAC